jgi:hypothetical protein
MFCLLFFISYYVFFYIFFDAFQLLVCLWLITRGIIWFDGVRCLCWFINTYFMCNESSRSLTVVVLFDYVCNVFANSTSRISKKTVYRILSLHYYCDFRSVSIYPISYVCPLCAAIQVQILCACHVRRISLRAASPPSKAVLFILYICHSAIIYSLTKASILCIILVWPMECKGECTESLCVCALCVVSCPCQDKLCSRWIWGNEFCVLVHYFHAPNPSLPFCISMSRTQWLTVMIKQGMYYAFAYSHYALSCTLFILIFLYLFCCISLCEIICFSSLPIHIYSIALAIISDFSTVG